MNGRRKWISSIINVDILVVRVEKGDNGTLHIHKLVLIHINH